MMYKSKTTTSKRLSVLAIVPAGILAIMAINLPAVASAINEVSQTSITLSNDDNAKDKQKLKLNGKVLSISTVANTDSTKMPSTTNTTVYINGNKQDASFDMNTIAPSDIESITVIKSGDNPGIYITLKSTKKETLPEFPGGYSKMAEWLSLNIKYPKEASKNKVNGTVVVKFEVLADGSIGEAEISNSINPELDKEALRVVKAMPKWNPGTVDGKPVAVWFSIPITFSTK